ncbi:trypsin-like peptidase domain-containing protein [Micromonospora sp. PLK6-60]|uniref:trypsin-like peptidase domain-containing protein n=1 Tax=Micromonospora sp. PLK6-60 TaxID=2873383 RepID=UPI001CA77348|nr:trypsin-like peptidase domain-containing protein [Micromonospora sp. PLK6-60]MBY8873462.1 trypsin-like peptidase domain-containing protein [Micromonospora sp. PLK6-60]
MSEYETDPQRRPGPSDAEPSHPAAERGQADSSTAPGDPSVTEAGRVDPPTVPGFPPASGDAPTSAFPAAPGDAPTSALPGHAPTTDYPAAPGDAPSTGFPATAPTTGFPATAPTTGHPAAAPTSGPYGGSGYAGSPYGSGPAPAAGGYPGSPWYSGQQQQQSGWAAGHPGHPAPAGQPGYPGQSYPGQSYPGGPVPPWAQGPQQHRPGRAVKFVGAGVAVLALMFGSGVAGGALALAVGGDGGTTRTYTAAPVINGADLPKIAAAVQDSVVSIMTDSGEGSGVILSADGFVLTNNHVVASATGDKVRVIFADGKSTDAEIVGTDPKTDLAVVKAGGVSGLKAATFGDSDAMQVGDQVLALGSPLGLQGSVTAGILSARDRTIRAGEGGQQQDPRQGASSISGLLQTDAPINPGNSGGALVNTRGEVIGINTAIATAGQGSTGNIGVGFAIPSNKAKDVASKLQRGEKVSHPSLGVSVNAAEGGGALVAEVVPGSAAEKAGLQRGDVITKFGDKMVNDSDDLVGAVQAGKVGDKVRMEFKRNGSSQTATVTLSETS